MKRKLAFILLAGTLLAALLAGAALTVPWRETAARQIQRALEARGLGPVRLTLADAGLRGATLRDITIGDETPVTLRNITLGYTPRELWNGTLRDIQVDGLALSAHYDGARWRFPGVMPGAAAAPFAIPVTPADVGRLLPFDNVKLTDSRLAATAADWQLETAITAAYARLPAPVLTLDAAGLSWRGKSLALAADAGTGTVTLPAGEDSWRGTWSLRNITVPGGPANLPALDGGGTVTMHAGSIAADGAFKSADGATAASFTLAFTPGGDSVLTVTRAAMPWKDGTVAVRDMRMTLPPRGPLPFDLMVENISVGELMQAMTGKRVTATGAVSGRVPLVLHPDGRIVPGQGHLDAAGPGTITMPPDAIPGDNPQIALTRDILRHFNYNVLSIRTETAPDGDTAIILTLEGSNPDVYDGRAVKLNVRLTGDVLDFIRQNVILLTTPEKLIQQDNGEQDNP